MSDSSDNSRKLAVLSALEDLPDMILAERLVEEMLYIEHVLTEMKKYPPIRVNAKNPAIQEQTDSSKAYLAYASRYKDFFSVLQTFRNRTDGGDLSDLRKFLKEDPNV
jgi:hypothetical protein